MFDKDGLTAAHKKLAFGTKVKVTNVENGKSVVVTVNDRMAASNPAVIDVTHRAADDLGFAKAGKAKVKVEVKSEASTPAVTFGRRRPLYRYEAMAARSSATGDLLRR